MAASDEENDVINYPAGRLGVVTRTQNAINQYCDNNSPPDVKELEKLKNTLQTKIKNFNDACEKEEEKDVDEEVKAEFKKWWTAKNTRHQIYIQKMQILILQQSENYEEEAAAEDELSEPGEGENDDEEPQIQSGNHQDNSTTAAILNQIFLQQQQSQLPKNEPVKFDGSDILEYHSFILAFECTIEAKCQSYQDKFYYLQSYTLGEARELVKSCHTDNHQDAFTNAKRVLHRHYGNDRKICQEYLTTIQNWTPVEAEDGAGIKKLSIFLNRLNNLRKNTSMLNQLNDLAQIKSIIMKLPLPLRKVFRTKVADLNFENKEVNFDYLVKFIERQSESWNLPLLGDVGDKHNKNKPRVIKTYATNHTNPLSKYCEFCRKTNHNLQYCFFFKKQPIGKRTQFISQNGICYGCLTKAGHQVKDCTNRLKCSKCRGIHPTALHRDDDSSANRIAEGVSKGERSYKTKNPQDLKISCPVIPVVLKCKQSGAEVKTYMALDSFSTSCYMDESLVKKLNLKGKQENINITTIDDEIRVKMTKIEDLEISSLDGSVSKTLQTIYAKKNWTFSKEDSPSQKDVESIAAFREIPFRFIDSSIGLLIGMNEPEMLRPTNTVESTKRGPYASHHMFGWALNGPVKGSKTVNNCLRTKHSDMKNLHSQFDKVFGQDFNEVSQLKNNSIDEDQWLTHIANNTKKLTNGQYEIKLPMKKKATMPNNYEQVHKRICTLKNKLNKNHDLKDDYIKIMDTMISKGFIERVPENEIAKEKWFLTHHGIRHKQKGKLRVVFDCSLQYKGVSLNDVLWKGPDLANTSVGVLLRFRINPIAVTADVEKMYHNIKVPVEDRNFLRFLWFEDHDLNSAPVEYRMTVHLFGATTSSSVANFALRRSVENHQNEEVQKIVENNFYVDDMMASFENDETAVDTVRVLDEALGESSFNLTQYASNSRKVLENIPNDKLATSLIDIFSNDESLPTERALGITWNTEKDLIGFNVKISDQPDTKRGLLSTIFSFYDPLFLASPAFVRAKRIFQTTCQNKLDWDDPLPANLLNGWHQWKSEIVNLKNLQIQRCYKGNTADVVDTQLHIFADGSEIAYGAVAYLRFRYKNGECDTSIVMSKARLTPLNRESLKTTPRIELNAAKVAAMLYEKLSIELLNHINLSQTIFWTDSIATLQYIRSETANLQRFVTNRVAYIRNITNVESWKFIPGKENPADILSRGVYHIRDLTINSLWTKGPEFLIKDPVHWPKEFRVPEISAEDSEVKKNKVLVTKGDQKDHPIETLMDSTSNYFKLKCRLATMLMYRKYLLKKSNVAKGISISEIQEAEHELIRYAQAMDLKGTYQLIKQNKPLPKKDHLRKLNPFIDEDKIMRVGGRISKAPIPFETRHPIILHATSKVTEFIITHHHNKLGHMGREYIMTDVRETLHIVKINPLIRRILNKCVLCKRVQGKPCGQIMADLPRDRLEGDAPPFTNTATDLFGPFYVSKGRGKSQEKRYGVVFSCLASRATHLEITPSLDTSSFINAFRRFISRRGTPRIMRSDNGTNLTAADKELKSAIKEWNCKQVQDYCKQQNIDWIFQPPYSSHKGGSHERQIRTVRKIFNSMLREFSNQAKLTDDLLNTLFCEVENILNCRPLSVVSSKCESNQPITPNHLLRLQSKVEFPPGVFNKDDVYSKRRWRQAQYLADIFWHRWRKEYLCQLQGRQKWTERKRSLKPGDVVLVIDQSLQRNHWLTGKIVEVKADEKGDVRSATVSVVNNTDFKKSEILRSVDKLILLVAIQDGN